MQIIFRKHLAESSEHKNCILPCPGASLLSFTISGPKLVACD